LPRTETIKLGYCSCADESVARGKRVGKGILLPGCKLSTRKREPSCEKKIDKSVKTDVMLLRILECRNVRWIIDPFKAFDARSCGDRGSRGIPESSIQCWIEKFTNPVPRPAHRRPPDLMLVTSSIDLSAYQTDIQ
jgi:hypothetical protein